MSKTKLNGKEYDLSKDKSRTEYWTEYRTERMPSAGLRISLNYLTEMVNKTHANSSGP